MREREREREREKMCVCAKTIKFVASFNRVLDSENSEYVFVLIETCSSYNGFYTPPFLCFNSSIIEGIV